VKKNDFYGIVARIKPFNSQKNHKVQMKFAENHYRGFQNSGKQFYLLTEANIMYLVEKAS
jgi:hypothetical protein